MELLPAFLAHLVAGTYSSLSAGRKYAHIFSTGTTVLA